MSTLAVNTITNAAGGNTAQINGQTPSESNMQGRNRIINGDMRISQRGTSFSGLTNGDSQHTVDRWRWAESGAATGVQTVTQDTSAPSGFVNSWKVQTTTAHSPLAATNSYRCVQQIEGNNVSDLAWGAASAQAVTLSFWVRSSLTGVFGGSVNNADGNRFYVFSYTVNATDTWEQKTITIVGDTTGTWGTGTGAGIGLAFSFGTGSSYLTTPGSWGSTRFDAPTGQVNVAGTLNATWYITGVQLEAGAVATPFERRPFGAELALCQRYAYFPDISGALWPSTMLRPDGVRLILIPFKQTMRAAPTATFTYLADGSGSSPATPSITPDYFRVNLTASLTGGADPRFTAFAASAEL